MSHLKIALFTGNYHHIRDGVSLTLNRLVGFLEDNGVDVLVFAPSVDKPDLQHKGSMISIPSVPIPGRPEYRFSLGLPDHVQRKLEDFDPDIVHIATPDILGYKALKWALVNRKQLVASYHTHFTSYLKYYKLHWIEWLAWKYLAWFYSNCTHVYVPSPSMADELQEHGISGKLKIWARGVNVDLFNPEKRDEEWRRKIGFTDDDIVVTFVSRLVWEKELATFAQSVKRVAQSNSRVKAMVVGDGPAMSGLQQMLPEAHYTGFIGGEELSRAYASSDVFMFPSHTETFGNVTLEAMASGLPCLVADATGSRSLVKHGVNGYLAEKKNTDDFTAKLFEITSKDQRRQQMGKESRKLAMDFKWETINGKLLNSYREALNSPVPQLKY